jgi:hypothetical protein
LLFVTAKIDPMDGNAQIGFTMNLGLAKREFTQGSSEGKTINGLDGLLFGKVESVSSTNKARSKILKLRT